METWTNKQKNSNTDKFDTMSTILELHLNDIFKIILFRG